MIVKSIFQNFDVTIVCDFPIYQTWFQNRDHGGSYIVLIMNFRAQDHLLRSKKIRSWRSFEKDPILMIIQ